MRKSLSSHSSSVLSTHVTPAAVRKFFFFFFPCAPAAAPVLNCDSHSFFCSSDRVSRGITTELAAIIPGGGPVGIEPGGRPGGGNPPGPGIIIMPGGIMKPGGGPVGIGPRGTPGGGTPPGPGIGPGIIIIPGGGPLGGNMKPGGGPVGMACVGIPEVCGATKGGGAAAIDIVLGVAPGFGRAPLISSSNLDISSAKEAALLAAIAPAPLQTYDVLAYPLFYAYDTSVRTFLHTKGIYLFKM
eukprot:scpid89038/ scgid1548/ 